jgi:alpha-1,6-mannosyltransferase
MLFGLNPVLLVFAVSGAHNDVIALLPLVAGIALVAAGRPALGSASVVGAIAVKATAGVALPFVLLGARRRGAALAGAVGGAAAIGVLAFLVFGGAAATEPLKLVAQHTHYYFEQSVPAHVAVLLGMPPRSNSVRMTAEVLAAVAVAALLVHTAVRRTWVSGAGWATLALLVSSNYMLAWYTIWILPFAATGRSRRLVGAALGLGTFVVVSRLYWLGQ